MNFNVALVVLIAVVLAILAENTTPHGRLAEATAS